MTRLTDRVRAAMATPARSAVLDGGAIRDGATVSVILSCGHRATIEWPRQVDTVECRNCKAPPDPEKLALCALLDEAERLLAERSVCPVCAPDGGPEHIGVPCPGCGGTGEDNEIIALLAKLREGT